MMTENFLANDRKKMTKLFLAKKIIQKKKRIKKWIKFENGTKRQKVDIKNTFFLIEKNYFFKNI